MSDSATPWTVARQAPPSTGLPRQEYWSGLLFSPPGIFPDQGFNPHLRHWQADSLLWSHLEDPRHHLVPYISHKELHGELRTFHGSLLPSPKGPALFLAVPKALHHMALPPIYILITEGSELRKMVSSEGWGQSTLRLHCRVICEPKKGLGLLSCREPQARCKDRGKDLIQGGVRELPGGPWLQL